jgi:hypothetical protein
MSASTTAAVTHTPVATSCDPSLVFLVCTVRLVLVDAGEAGGGIAIMKLVELPSGFTGHLSTTVSARRSAPIEIRRGLVAGPDMSAMPTPNPNSINEVNMVTKSEAFPTRFFKTADIPRDGLVVQIAKIEREKVGTDQEYKWVAYFKGQEKQLVVNASNWDLIADALREANSDNWVGKAVELYPTTTQFGGKMVDCIRARRHRPAAAAPPAQPPKTPPANGGDLDDQIPF